MAIEKVPLIETSSLTFLQQFRTKGRDKGKEFFLESTNQSVRVYAYLLFSLPKRKEGEKPASSHTLYHSFLLTTRERS